MVSGSVRIFVARGERARTIAVAHPCDSLGEMGILDPGVGRVATAVGLTDAQVIVLPRQVILSIITGSPEAVDVLLRGASREGLTARALLEGKHRGRG